MVDANILLYAEDAESPLNRKACQWWDSVLSGEENVCLCWLVINAFIRISTNPRVFHRPLSIAVAVRRVQSWIDQPCVKILTPLESHWSIFQEMIESGQASANLITDTHLVALAVEYGCDFYSTDSDFARFPGLKWKNPIKNY